MKIDFRFSTATRNLHAGEKSENLCSFVNVLKTGQMRRETENDGKYNWMNADMSGLICLWNSNFKGWKNKYDIKCWLNSIFFDV